MRAQRCMGRVPPTSLLKRPLCKGQNVKMSFNFVEPLLNSRNNWYQSKKIEKSSIFGEMTAQSWKSWKKAIFWPFSHQEFILKMDGVARVTIFRTYVQNQVMALEGNFINESCSKTLEIVVPNWKFDKRSQFNIMPRSVSFYTEHPSYNEKKLHGGFHPYRNEWWPFWTNVQPPWLMLPMDAVETRETARLDFFLAKSYLVST